MNRIDKILYHIDKNEPGIEIGPSHSPMASKKDGYHTHILDHINREQLIDKYKDHHVKLQNIEEVDFIWRGESYADLTGKEHFYDWIIASHVIEHTPDLITLQVQVFHGAAWKWPISSHLKHQKCFSSNVVAIFDKSAVSINLKGQPCDGRPTDIDNRHHRLEPHRFNIHRSDRHANRHDL